MDKLDTLFHTTLKDIYYAERQITKALPKMARAAHSDELRQAFLMHRDETNQQIERLQQVFEKIGKRAQGSTCEAINGIVEECDELLDDMKEASAVRDAGLIACAQAVEHYEMARYGTLVVWARALGQPEAAELLAATLEEEKATDKLLSQMGQRSIRRDAGRS